MVYTCINDIRDKSNNIISCELKDSNGNIITVEKNELKQALKEQRIEVNNLYLDAKGALRKRDNMINEYIKSCKLLGITPLVIDKLDSDYLIVDINETKNAIQIPPFVTGIHMSKCFNLSTNNMNQVEITSSTNEKLIGVLQKLVQQQFIKQEKHNFVKLATDINKLNDRQNNLLTDSIIDDKIDKLGQMI